MGTTVSTEQSFSSSYGLSASGSAFGFGAEISGDYTTTETNGDSQTIAQTEQNSIKTTGSGDGINHDQDTFILLLNPEVAVASGEVFHPDGAQVCVPTVDWRVVVNGPAAQLYKLSVRDLKSYDSLDANKKSVMSAHGITKEDFATILSLNPFARGQTAIDPTRYYRTTHSFPYERADSASECTGGICACVSMSSQKVNNESHTTMKSTKTSYSVGMKEEAGGGAKELLSGKVTASQKFTWTATASKSNTTSGSKSATVTIQCPSQAWKSADDYTLIDVYWDTWFGSFMFAPTVVSEAKPGENTFAEGQIKTGQGQSLNHEPVTIAVDGKAYRTLTNSNGNFAVYGIPKVAGGSTATVTIRNRSYQVRLGSEAERVVVQE